MDKIFQSEEYYKVGIQDNGYNYNVILTFEKEDGSMCLINIFEVVRINELKKKMKRNLNMREKTQCASTENGIT